MHFGNLCFFLDDSLPLQVTPSYDMLPMMYRPAGNGAVVPRDFRVAVPLPADLLIWRQVAGWAEDYWQRVSVEALVSDGLRKPTGQPLLQHAIVTIPIAKGRGRTVGEFEASAQDVTTAMFKWQAPIEALSGRGTAEGR